jgi:EmrB/QacA subfamily drug resistance transporter
MPNPAKIDRLDRRTIVIAGTVTLGVIMSALDTTIVNVALDKLAGDLHAPLSTVQWVSTGYLLSLAVVIPLSGWMTERFGIKRVWLASVALFGIGSALCGLSSSPGELVAFRVLQGLGGGMLLPVGITLVTTSAGPHRVGRILSLVGVPVLLGPIFGPIVGGLIVDSASWHWIFFVNVPIAVVALIVAARVLDADRVRREHPPLDWRGAALLCPGLVSIVFGLSETETHGGVGDPLAFAPILAGLALTALFVVHALHTAHALIDMRLFRSRAFSAAAATTFLLGAALFGALLILPLYYQVDRGQSALNAGLLMAPQGIGAALALPISGRLTDRGRGGLVVLFGCLVATAATLPWFFVGAGTPYALLAAALVVRGIGMGCTIQPAMATAYALLRPEQVPGATAALNTLRQIGGSIGTALVAVVLSGQAKAALPAGGAGTADLLQPLSPSVRAQVAGPVATAFGHTFAWVAGMTAVSVLAAVILLRAERDAAREDAAPAPARRQAPDGSELRKYVSVASTRRCSVGPGARSSFWKMLVTCFSTAASLTKRLSAMPRFDLPSAIDPSTSRSRGLSRSTGLSGARRPSIRRTTSGSSALPPAATRPTASTKASTSPTRSLSK